MSAPIAVNIEGDISKLYSFLSKPFNSLFDTLAETPDTFFYRFQLKFTVTRLISEQFQLFLLIRGTFKKMTFHAAGLSKISIEIHKSSHIYTQL